MASKATQSLTTGMKILGGANLPTYTLEFLTPTAKHARGSYVTIAVPYAELGRKSSCTLRFGDDSQTVSRRHAAIERKGDDIFIKNLSSTNPTLVNGRPVNDRYFLNNGDEIQLSMEGPRLRFNETSTGTAKMGFTNRMNLVMQQSIRPYKVAAISFFMVFLLVTSGSGYAIYELTKQSEALQGELALQNVISQAQADSLAALNLRNQDLEENFQLARQDFEQRNRNLEQELEDYKERSDSLLQLASGGGSYVELIEPVKNQVLAIYEQKKEIVYNSQEIVVDLENRMMCTGFLIEGGIFVTARHCVDSGLTDSKSANFYQHSGGKATYYYTAQSYDGSISFQFTNHDLVADYSKDELKRAEYVGLTGTMRIPDYFSGADWAYMQTSYDTGVPFDKELSRNLQAGEELLVLGYSYGTAFRTGDSMEPYFSTSKVTLSGIQGGIVHVAEAGWDGGNSGGPVFAVKNGRAVAIGLVTGTFRKPELSAMEDVVMINAGIKMVTPLANF